MPALRKKPLVPVMIDHSKVAASALAEAAQLFIAANELLAEGAHGNAAWNLEKSKQWMNTAITHLKIQDAREESL